ncbi:MAG: RIP metalloprotease RseP [Polyangiaceae bacterium]
MDLVYFAILCSALIFVHELGHFVWAKIFGVKVLTFSIGFGPKIVRLRGRETEYCIGLLPLGGFVKMLEETRETVLPEDRGRTFEAQAIWKRVIIVLAGPLMNIIFPILLYFAVYLGDGGSAPPTIGQVMPGHPAEGKLLQGDRVLEVNGTSIYTFAELQDIISKNPGKELPFTVFRNRERVEVTITPNEKRIEKPLDLVDTIGEIGITPHQPAAVIGVPLATTAAYRAGLRTFDVIIEVRGKPVRTYSDLEATLADNKGETVPVAYLRPVRVPSALGTMADLSVYDSGVAALTPEINVGGTIQQRTGIELADLYVADVPESSAEFAAGLRYGDRILSVDNIEVTAWTMFEDKLFAAPERTHAIVWERQGVRKTGNIGLRREKWTDEYGQERLRYPPLAAKNWLPVVAEPIVTSPHRVWHAFEGALRETYDVTRFILVGIVRIVQGKVSLSTLGGPITVYDVVGAESQKGISYFIWAMAVISINLGLINLLPVPVLDGGHLLFFLYEAILRRKPPLRVREVASLIGMVLLVGLMGIAFKNDVERRWDVIQGQIRELFNR